MAAFVQATRAPDAAALIQSGSPELVEQTLANVRSHDSWLDAGHVYADVVGALQNTSSGVDGVSMAEYISYSAPLHLADGWSFLARAFEALKAGDANGAVHMGYYAELRAALSLLASEGVGVFRDRHVAVNDQQQPTDYRAAGTHVAAWRLLDAWANDGVRSANLLDVIKVEQKSIREWFDEAGIWPQVVGMLGREWLQQWSIDLSTFTQDRELRNQVSYRPAGISSAANPPANLVQDVVEPLLSIWDSLAPSGFPGEAVIDQALMSLALSYFRDKKNYSLLGWTDLINHLFESASQTLKSTLVNSSTHPSAILTWAQDKSDPPSTNSVLSRATLLLRLANAMCAERFEHASVVKEDLRFWWDRVGQDCGFWATGDEPEIFDDLWFQVQDASREVRSEMAQKATPISMVDLNGILGPRVPLTQHQRALLWMLRLDP